MAYPDNPPFEILADDDYAFLQSVTLTNGAVIILYAHYADPAQPCYIAELDITNQTLINNTVIFDETDLPAPRTSYTASLCVTATGRIGVCIIANGGGGTTLGYMAVEQDGSTYTNLTFYGVAPETGGNRFAARIGPADLLTYEVCVCWVDASNDLKAAVIDEFGNLDNTGTVVTHASLPALYSLSDPYVTAGTNGTMVFSCIVFSVALQTGYVVAGLCDIPPAGPLVDYTVAVDDWQTTIAYAGDANQIVAFVMDTTLGGVDIWTITQTGLLTLTMNNPVTVAAVSPNVNTLGGLFYLSNGDLGILATDAYIGSPPGYSLTEYQPGSLTQSFQATLLFHDNSQFGFMGNDSGNGKAYAQTFSASGAITFNRGWWNYGITVMSCLPCRPIAPVMYDPKTGQWV